MKKLVLMLVAWASIPAMAMKDGPLAGDHMDYRPDAAYRVKAFVSPEGKLLTVESMIRNGQRLPPQCGQQVECLGRRLHIIVIDIRTGDMRSNEERDYFALPEEIESDSSNYYLTNEADKTFGI